MLGSKAISRIAWKGLGPERLGRVQRAVAFVAAIAVIGRALMPGPPPRSIEGLAAMLGEAAGGAVLPGDIAWEPSPGILAEFLWGRRVLFLGRSDNTATRDLFRARVRLTLEGRPVAVAGLHNLTATPLGDEQKLRGVIKDELLAVKEKFADPRRSQITFDAGELDLEDLIDDEELVVTMSAKGYVKSVLSDAFKAQGRGGRGIAGAKLRDDDYVTHILTTTAHAYLLFFSNLGRVYRLVSPPR